MKILLTLFVLFFSPSVFADDISDFQIDGISIGDSLLDHYSEEEILKEIERNLNFYETQGLDNTFVEVYFFGKNTYDVLSFFIKPNDQKYIIYSLSGRVEYKENINQCYYELNEIVEEISLMFEYKKKNEIETTHPADITGKSNYKSVEFFLNSNERVQVYCMDFDESMQTEGDNVDSLLIFMDSKEFVDWFK